MQLVVQTSFLGDVVLTTPLLVELASRGPVDVVVTPAAAPLIATHPAVRAVIAYDKAHSGIAGLWGLSRRLRHTYDSAYLAQGSLRSAALARLAGIPERIGFASSAGAALYTRRVPYEENHHHVERLLSLAGGGGQPSPSLYPAAADVAAVEDLLTRAGATGEPLIALAPGSVWATKRWPGFQPLADALAPLGRIVWIGSAQDRGLVPASQDKAIDAVGQLSLLGSAELIRRARVLVTNDSLPQHLASAMGTPTVTIFGPTVPRFGFGPLAPQHAVAEVTNLVCRPCDRHGPRRCPLGHWKCMRELAVEDVLGRVRSIL